MKLDFEEELVFMQSGNVPLSMLPVVESIDASGVRVILMELFGWLKRQHRFGHEKPLELNQDHTWCKNLPTFFEKQKNFGRIFLIDGKKLRFREEILAEKRNELRESVVSGYTPVLKT
jgi:hypothetical protein